MALEIEQRMEAKDGIRLLDQMAGRAWVRARVYPQQQRPGVRGTGRAGIDRAAWVQALEAEHSSKVIASAWDADHTAENLAILRRWALNFLKTDPRTNDPSKQKSKPPAGTTATFSNSSASRKI
ncbi:MAG: hypothetical protein K8R23_10755 [Chthoniobacter sp.]|nr:hypothetical protein [Chthoniobacter sp.]